MKRILITISVLLCSVTAASFSQEKRSAEVPCAETGTQVEANECARRDYQKADVEMNKMYRQLMTELASSRGTISKSCERRRLCGLSIATRIVRVSLQSIWAAPFVQRFTVHALPLLLAKGPVG